jgi:hypothetical protein
MCFEHRQWIFKSRSVNVDPFVCRTKLLWLGLMCSCRYSFFLSFFSLSQNNKLTSSFMIFICELLFAWKKSVVRTWMMSCSCRHIALLRVGWPLREVLATVNSDSCWVCFACWVYSDPSITYQFYIRGYYFTWRYLLLYSLTHLHTW